MVSSESGSFAMELYNALKTFPFKGMVSFIRKSSSVTRKEFNDCEQSKEYWLDTRNCKHGRKVNKQCVLKCLEPSQMRTQLMYEQACLL